MAGSRDTTHPNAEAFPKGVSGPALRALAAARVRALDDLQQWTKNDLAALHGMGPKVLGILENEMRQRGLRFRDAGV
jgi:hypothetical protein